MKSNHQFALAMGIRTAHAQEKRNRLKRKQRK